MLNVNQLELCVTLLLCALVAVICDISVQIVRVTKLENQVKSQQKTIDVFRTFLLEDVDEEDDDDEDDDEEDDDDEDEDEYDEEDDDEDDDDDDDDDDENEDEDCNSVTQ